MRVHTCILGSGLSVDIMYAGDNTMCEKYKQVQYQCTIVWSGGYIETTLPPEWAFTTTPDTLDVSVERRWQLIKGDDNLVVKDFRILRVRDDVPTEPNQIPA